MKYIMRDILPVKRFISVHPVMKYTALPHSSLVRQSRRPDFCQVQLTNMHRSCPSPQPVTGHGGGGGGTRPMRSYLSLNPLLHLPAWTCTATQPIHSLWCFCPSQSELCCTGWYQVKLKVLSLKNENIYWGINE